MKIGRVAYLEVYPFKLVLTDLTQRAANTINKKVQSHGFVYKICKSGGKYFLYFKLKVD